MIVLDTSPGPYTNESFEDAVRVAASFIQAAIERRYPVEFRATSGVSGSIDPTGHGRTDVFDKLALVGMAASDPGLRALVRLSGRRRQGVALGVVTGQASTDQLNTVGAVRGRYEMVTLAQLGERFDRPPAHLSGVLSLNASTSDDFERRWKTKVR
jgi:uncharacterized protein (DUF58 family)